MATQRPAPRPRPSRPNIMGTRHAVSSGHYLATGAGMNVLEAGGNAIDAGVAAGLVLNVVESSICGVAGVAPIMIYMADTGRIVTLDGLGAWPRKASCEFFNRQGITIVPEGILQTVVPGAADSWLTALGKFGTMTFSEVAAAAIRIARDGFPMHDFMAGSIRRKTADFPEGSASAKIFLPGGRAPEVGDLFVQADLAATLQFMADQEASARGGRTEGIRAARDAFYRGDIARAILAFHRDNGGLLEEDDMARHQVSIDAPVRVGFEGVDVYSCGPWCQGPLLQQSLNIIKTYDLASLGHNSTAYVHIVTEAIKLAAADREKYYGDPNFVEVPLDRLLSPNYASERAGLIDMDRAWPGMPPAGEVGLPPRTTAGFAPSEFVGADLDTSYVCAADSYGNAFSATPSDGVMRKSPVVPGLGIVPSPRGLQSRLDPNHPSSVAPGKRPRLTPNPAMVMKEGEFVMPFGTPGGDLQTQAMLQFLANVFVFGMDMQSAAESPRFYSFSFPDSFAPHPYLPGRLRLEDKLHRDVGEELARIGHDVERWPDKDPQRTSICAIRSDARTGMKTAVADIRKMAYAFAS